MNDSTCTIDGCERKRAYALFCKMHYTRWKRHGDPLIRLRKESIPTGKGACSVDDCEKEQQNRGLCPMHYQRVRKFGSLESPMPTLEERFWAKVDKTDSCWLWTAATDGSGYGQIWTDKERREQAHRVAYELAIGPIPEGKHLDHICHMILCVNPEHLRAVSVKENLEHRMGAASHSKTGIRGVSPYRGNRFRAALTHNQEHVWIGAYSTIEEAEAAVVAKRLELFTHNDADRGY